MYEPTCKRPVRNHCKNYVATDMTTCHVLIYKIAFISVYSPVSVADYFNMSIYRKKHVCLFVCFCCCCFFFLFFFFFVVVVVVFFVFFFFCFFFFVFFFFLFVF